MRYAMFFLDEPVVEFIAAVLISIAGLCLMTGARRTGGGLLLTAVALIILPPLIEAAAEDASDAAADFAALLPWWVLIAGAVLVSLVASRWILALAVGRRAADHAMGEIVAALAIRTLTWVVKLPFAIVGAIVRAIRRT